MKNYLCPKCHVSRLTSYWDEATINIFDPLGIYIPADWSLETALSWNSFICPNCFAEVDRSQGIFEG